MARKKRKNFGPSVILVGGIAQLGEHLLCKQGVRSSNLLTSTNIRERIVIRT